MAKKNFAKVNGIDPMLGYKFLLLIVAFSLKLIWLF